MHRRLVVGRLGSIAFVVAWLNVPPDLARAQSSEPSGPPPHEHSMPAESEPPSATREGSGTSWLPDASPMYAIHWRKGEWQVMAHENVFIQFLHESSGRGDDQFGSINWLMGSAQRSVGPGRLQLRGMFSAEPGTIRGCGYPDLLATGESCRGDQIHDRQHPHDLFMEISALYDAPLTGQTRWQLYGALSGEPALGPVGYPHRISAMPNPIAPISHHWLDSTHITYGVITAGLFGARWKAEASVFNGREPDDQRTNLDWGKLDSTSARVWFLPTARWALQASIGKLNEAEVSSDGHGRIDVTRATASATYHAGTREGRLWATTVAWGRNAEPDHSSNALLLETTLTFEDRDSFFGRYESVGKSAHDLAVPEPPESFTVAKLQGGYTRYFRARRGFQAGVGGAVSAGFVPPTLQAAYGSRVNGGFGVFLTVRPAAASSHVFHLQASEHDEDSDQRERGAVDR
jgi:hypothetical protein